MLLLISFSSTSSSNLHFQNTTDNWAVLVDTSRYWFNYRHLANTLSLYHSIREMGIPDSHIILMVADEMACNPRNPISATVFNNKDHGVNLYGCDSLVDYRGYSVTPLTFLRVLTNRQAPGTRLSQTLKSGPNSNVLVYLTGHGGDSYLKFQDTIEITDLEFEQAFRQMKVMNSFSKLLFISDTCQAATLFKNVKYDGVLNIASSKLTENSYSHHQDTHIGVPIIDRWAHLAYQFFSSGGITKNVGENSSKKSKFLQAKQRSMAEFVSQFDYKRLSSTVLVDNHLGENLKDVKVGEFFGSYSVALQSQPWTNFEADLTF